jgi:uncharacterized protein YvpB
MIAVERPAAEPQLQPAISAPASHAVRRERSGLAIKLGSVFVVFAVFATVDGGWLYDTGAALLLQSRASALHAYWGLMKAEGVPGEELAQLEEQWAYTQGTTVLGAAGAFWWPGASVEVNRWQAETEAIWNRAVARSREGALAAQRGLMKTRGTGPFLESKAHFDDLILARTPADFNTLRAQWTVEAKLVSIDKQIRSVAAVLSSLGEQASGLGIRSDPAPDLLRVASDYPQLVARERMARAEFLTRRLMGVQVDLKGRLDAAAVAQQSFKRAADVLAVAELYGIGVSDFQARIGAARAVYANALKVSEFGDMTAAVNQVLADADHAIYVVLSQTHIISGVPFIYQNHSLSCEEAATSMAMAHQGIYVSQDQILAEIGADTRPMYVDGQGRVRWGNPYQTFVGNVNGSESNWTGFGTYYPPLVRMASAHGARIIQYGNISAPTIYARLIAGHPVVVFSTWDWQWHPRHDYLSFDGQWIPYIGPVHASHVYTAVGVSPGAVLINDPIRGQYWVSKGSFEAAYSDFNEAIVFA